MYTVHSEFTALAMEPSHGFRLHIVENPLAILLPVDNELWLYWHPGGNRVLSGWYFYFECIDGRCSQLFGPFYARAHAEEYAHSQDYWRSLRWQHMIDR